MRDFATCLSSRLADAPTAPSGEEVAKGEAPPEAVAAAAPQEGADTETPGPRAPPPPRRGRRRLRLSRRRPSRWEGSGCSSPCCGSGSDAGSGGLR